MKKLFSALLLLVIAHSVQAQEGTGSASGSFPTGLLLEYKALGTSFKTKDQSAAIGGGASIRLGWQLNSRLAIYVGSEGTLTSKTRFSEALPEASFRWGLSSVGARYNIFTHNESLVYFVDAAYNRTGARIHVDEVLLVKGDGFSIGGGLYKFFAPKWAFTSSLQYGYANFDRIIEDDVKRNADISGSTVRLSAGVIWFPLKR